jgi:hypothetical protein
MNEKGNRYVIHALKDRRATVAGEIVQFKRAIRDRESWTRPLRPAAFRIGSRVASASP